MLDGNSLNTPANSDCDGHAQLNPRGRGPRPRARQALRFTRLQPLGPIIPVPENRFRRRKLLHSLGDVRPVRLNVGSGQDCMLETHSPAGSRALEADSDSLSVVFPVQRKLYSSVEGSGSGPVLQCGREVDQSDRAVADCGRMLGGNGLSADRGTGYPKGVHTVENDVTHIQQHHQSSDYLQDVIPPNAAQGNGDSDHLKGKDMSDIATKAPKFDASTPLNFSVPQRPRQKLKVRLRTEFSSIDDENLNVSTGCLHGESAELGSAENVETESFLPSSRRGTGYPNGVHIVEDAVKHKQQHQSSDYLQVVIPANAAQVCGHSYQLKGSSVSDIGTIASGFDDSAPLKFRFPLRPKQKSKLRMHMEFRLQDSEGKSCVIPKTVSTEITPMVARMETWSNAGLQLPSGPITPVPNRQRRRKRKLLHSLGVCAVRPNVDSGQECILETNSPTGRRVEADSDSRSLVLPVPGELFRSVKGSGSGSGSGSVFECGHEGIQADRVVADFGRMLGWNGLPADRESISGYGTEYPKGVYIVEDDVTHIQQHQSSDYLQGVIPPNAAQGNGHSYHLKGNDISDIATFAPDFDASTPLKFSIPQTPRDPLQVRMRTEFSSIDGKDVSFGCLHGEGAALRSVENAETEFFLPSTRIGQQIACFDLNNAAPQIKEEPPEPPDAEQKVSR